MEYNFKKLEEKWQNKWAKEGAFKIKNPNYFVLSMWPYPSGKLHMGHLRNYLLGDVIARFKAMQGLKVLHPMGWDAFGLPAENAAMEKKVHPEKWTLENIENMKEELKKIGFSFDWNKEEASCLPSYFKFEQKMFLDFLAKGIAYKKESIVNWDPVDNTVLANEQVIEGKGWRSGALVEKRLLSQWFLKISAFSEELLEGLKTLPKWPEKVKTMQENWIGRSTGCEVEFKVENSNEVVKIFTTRPETLFGASFVAVAYNHPLIKKIGVSPLPLGEGQGEGLNINRFGTNAQGGQNPNLTVFARKMRQNPTEAENKFWNAVRNNELGFKFRRQYPVYSSYIADFICLEKRLIVEIDGENHAESKKDLMRDEYFKDYNFRVLRFWNNDILQNLEGCIESILKVLTEETSPHPAPLPEVEGERLIAFIKECEVGSTKTEDVDTAEKKGFFTGLYCQNPVNGELLPVYIANFVLMEYGTGALFGCPAHDVRDYEFALKYGLPIKQVVFEEEPPFKEEFKIETPNFTIRPFEKGDLNDLTKTLLELNQNPNWVKKPLAEEMVKLQAKRKLEMYIDWQKEFGFSRWAVVKPETNEFIGGAGFCFFYPDKRSFNSDAKKTDVEIGYWFLKKFHGKGYAIEITKAIIAWAEENLPHLKITAVTTPGNIASQKILKKLGFEEKGEIFHSESGIEDFFLRELKPKLEKPMLEDGYLYNSGFLNGFSVREGREMMFKKFGKKVNFRLKDWGVSRQRYWGCPIPVINCPACGVVPVPAHELPVVLPKDVKIEPGENPLKKHPTWRFVDCPKCGGKAERETDTLDTFFESSWYFLRFSGGYENGVRLEDVAFKNPLKVNDYIGGIEHAILHLLYARFFNRALKKCGYDVPFEEPFERLITQGMVCHKTFQDLEGRWLTPEEASIIPENLVNVGASIKMSKSKKNVVEPATIVNEHGADTARFFMASDTPPERDMEWSAEGVVASHRFLSKVWNFAGDLTAVKALRPAPENLKTLYKLLNYYRQEIEGIMFNKSVARIRELSNLMFSLPKPEAKFVLEHVLIMLFPFAPHISSELAEKFGFNLKDFPEIPQEFLEDETCIISVQINGKTRGVLTLPKGLSETEVRECVLQDEKIMKHLHEKVIKKEVFVKDKIFSFVV